MNNLIQGIKNLFSNVSVSNSYELQNLKSENPAAEALTAEAPRAQYCGSPKIEAHSLFNAICRAMNTVDVKARAATLGREMAKGVEAIKSFFSPAQAVESDSMPVMRASRSRASSTAAGSAALDGIFKAMGQKNPTGTIEALKVLKELPGVDEEKSDSLVQSRLREVGKNKINAFKMVHQFLSSDPWEIGQPPHDDVNNEVRQFYADLCKSFERNWTAMSR